MSILLFLQMLSGMSEQCFPDTKENYTPAKSASIWANRWFEKSAG